MVFPFYGKYGAHFGARPVAISSYSEVIYTRCNCRSHKIEAYKRAA